MYSRIRSIKALAAWSVCLAVLLGARPAQAGDVKDLLKHVPEDAWGFVLIPSVEHLDAKTKMISQKLGEKIPALAGLIAQNPMLPLGDALDTGSPLGIVILDMNQYANQGVAVLVPTKEPAALLKKLGAGEEKDGHSECKVMGQTVFAAVKDKLVILSPDEDVLVKMTKAKKTLAADFDPVRAEALGKCDFFLSLSPKLILKAYREMIVTMLPMIAGPSGMNAASIEQILNLLTQINSLDLFVSTNENGVTLSWLVCPVANSTLAKATGDYKNAKDPLLARLPKEDFLLAFGKVSNSSPYDAEFGEDSMIKSALEGAASKGLDSKAIKALVDEGKKLEQGIRSMAFAVSLLPEGPDGLLGLTVVCETKSATDFVAGLRKCWTMLGTISEDEEYEKFLKGVTHTPDAETVDGKKVDTIAVDLAKFEEDVDEDEAAKVHKLLGKELVVRFGAPDANLVVLSFGGGLERYKAACSSAKSSANGLGGESSIAASSKALPSQRSMEFFVSVDSILKAVKRGAKAVGEKDEIPFDVAPINAPVAVSAAIQGKMTRGDVHVPMKLISAAKKMIEDSKKAQMKAFDEEGEGDDDMAEDAPKAEKKAPAKPKKDADEEDEKDDDGDDR